MRDKNGSDVKGAEEICFRVIAGYAKAEIKTSMQLYKTICCNKMNWLGWI